MTVPMDAYMSWRLERSDLAEAEAAGLGVGWLARPGGGVVVVTLPDGDGTLSYRTLAEAGAFLDGWVVRARWADLDRPAGQAVIEAAIAASAHAVTMELHHMGYKPGHPPEDPFCEAFNAYRDVVRAVMQLVGAAKVLDLNPRRGRPVLEAPYYDLIHGQGPRL